MTTFDKREQAFENRFAHDEELAFKAVAHRNHKLGLWAAQLLGKTGNDAETYALEIVAIGVEGAGETTLAEKLHADFAAGGVARSDHQIHRQMDEMLVEAHREIRTA